MMARHGMLFLLIGLWCGAGAWAGQPGVAGEAESPEDSLAETDASLSLRKSPGWTVRVEPMGWAAAVGGDFIINGSGGIDAEWINADEVNFAPAGRATIAADAWRFVLEGMAVSVDGDERVSESFMADGVAFARGTDVSLDLDLTVISLTAGHEVWRDEFTEDVALALEVYGGLRLIDVDLSLENSAGAEIGGDGTWIEPLVGLGVSFDLPRGFDVRFTIDGGASLGGEIGFDWQVTTALGWRFNDHVGLEIGFRHLSLDVTDGDDDFAFEGWTAGLFGSVVIYF